MDEQILGVLLQIQQQIGGVQQQVSSLQQQFDGIEKRLDSLENRMDGIEKRLDSLENRMDSLENRMGSLENRMDGMENRMDGMENRMDGMEHEMKDMRSEFSFHINSVDEKMIKLQVTTETKIIPHISLLAEGHSGMSEKVLKIDAIADDVEETKVRVELIEMVVKKNNKAINKINETVFH